MKPTHTVQAGELAPCTVSHHHLSLTRHSKENMKKLFIASLLLLCSHFLHAQYLGVSHRLIVPPSITYVSGTSATAGANLTVTTAPVSCAAGNYLYIYAGLVPAGIANQTFSISTTSGNTITSVVANKHDGLTSGEVFNVASCNGTTGTYTLTCVTNYCEFAVLQFSHVTGVDATNTCFSGTYIPSCSVTTAAPRTYVIGSHQTESASGGTTESGWTDLRLSFVPSSTISNDVGLVGQLQRTAGVVTSTPQGDGNPSDSEIMVALK